MQAKPNMQYPTKVGVLSPRTRCTVGYTGKKMSILTHSTQTIEQIKHIGIKKTCHTIKYRMGTSNQRN